MIRIVLVEPEIPQNTGNIARTCVCTGTPLLITEPMGFTITEAKVRRAGLDYWSALDLTIYPNLETIYQEFPDGNFWYFSSKATTVFTQAHFEPDCFLVFGKETKGLPAPLLAANKERCVTIPMVSTVRCLNLSNCACVGLYEALRQNDYMQLCQQNTED